jgi:hypothetical protein
MQMKKTDIQRVPKGQKHPYEAFERSPLWRAIDRALIDLVGNGDLRENEYHEYIVGYLCKSIERKKRSIVGHLQQI